MASEEPRDHDGADRGTGEGTEEELGGTVLPFPTAPDRESRRDRPAPTPLRDVIGEVLRDARRAEGRTLAEVADDAAVSLPYLSEIERGRKEPSSDVVRSVSEAVGLPLPDLLEESARRLRQIEATPIRVRGHRRSAPGSDVHALAA